MAMVSSLEPWAMTTMLMLRWENCREDAAGQARGAAHAFAYNSEQADFAVYFDGMKIAVSELQGQALLQCSSARSSSDWRTRKQKLWV